MPLRPRIQNNAAGNARHRGVKTQDQPIFPGSHQFIFQMPLGQSPLGLLLLTLALALASTSLGMLLGAVCRTSKQAENLGTALGFILLALGGSIFPLFLSEGFMGTLSRLTPNAWAI